MEHPQSTVFLNLRLTLEQKGKLLQMARKAGDPNPSVTVRRIVFGERRPPSAIRRSKGLPRKSARLAKPRRRTVTHAK